MTMGYLLGIDVGTTRTAAATGRTDAGLGDFELLAPAIYAIAALTTITTIQRVWHVKKQLSSEAPGAAPL